MKRFSCRWFMTVLALSVGVCSFSPAPSGADEVYTFVIKKQEQKAKTRWSLSEWLETRDRMRLMDLWLAMHSPSPYEFYLSGAWSSSDSGAQGRLQGFDFSAGAYASIFGLGLERQVASGTSETAGLLFLRIFGFQAQGTNITLQAGIENMDRAEGHFRNAVAGVGSSIYIGRYFGVDGVYRHLFDSVPGSSAARLSGSRYEGGAFIDFKFLRVFGKYFSNSFEFSTGGVSASNTGVSGGLKVFF